MALPDLRRRDLVQQLLDQAQRADPAADRPSQNHAEQCQDAHHVPGRGMPGGVQCILQGAQWAAGDRSGAGIAIEPGNADGFQVSGLDMAVNKAFEVRVIKQGGIQLHQAAGARATDVFIFVIHRLIQGRHTPYR